MPAGMTPFAGDGVDTPSFVFPAEPATGGVR